MDNARSKALRIRAAEAQGWTGEWRFGSTHLHGTPPEGNRGMYGDHVPEVIDTIIKDLTYELMVSNMGIEAVRDLITESSGVAGLHLNGDIAPWDDLEEGGEFWEWLTMFHQTEYVANLQKTTGPVTVKGADNA